MIYVRGRMIGSSRAGDIAIDPIWEERMGPRSERRVTLKELDHWLEITDRPEGMRPIVVLEVPPTQSKTEDLEQLALRNMFAGELFALGNTPAVIGIGFDDPHSAELARTLADGFRDRVSLEDLMIEVRRLAEKIGGTDRYDHAALRSIALHAYEPAMISIVPAESPPE
jgi:hypothetical protein